MVADSKKSADRVIRASDPEFGIPIDLPVASVKVPVIEELSFVGVRGGVFNVRGNFSETPGEVTISGKLVPLTSWRSNVIKGIVPISAKPGEVVVTDGDGNVFKIQSNEF